MALYLFPSAVLVVAEMLGAPAKFGLAGYISSFENRVLGLRQLYGDAPSSHGRSRSALVAKIVQSPFLSSRGWTRPCLRLEKGFHLMAADWQQGSAHAPLRLAARPMVSDREIPAAL